MVQSKNKTTTGRKPKAKITKQQLENDDNVIINGDRNRNGNDKEKYFAFFIPNNRPSQMCNINEQLVKKYGYDIASNIYKRITQLSSYGDVQFTNTESVDKYSKSLVICKFRDVNKYFDTSINTDNTDNNNDNTSNINNIDKKSMNKFNDSDNDSDDSNDDSNDDADNLVEAIEFINPETYKLVNTVKILHRDKIFDIYDKSKCVFFTGNLNSETAITNKTNYNFIFGEFLLIPLTNILNAYHNIKFDETFDENITSYIAENLITPEITTILRILNSIFKSEQIYMNTHRLADEPLEILTPNNSKKFLPLLDHHNYTDGMRDLWTYIIKPTSNIFKIFENYKNIDSNNKLVRSFIPESQNLGVVLSSGCRDLCCVLNRTLYYTTKKFQDINYIDALPIKAILQCNETESTYQCDRHNNIYRTLNEFSGRYNNLTHSNAKQTAARTRMLNDLKKRINTLTIKLLKLDERYVDHIAYNSYLCAKLHFTNNIMRYKSFVYMGEIFSNIDIFDDLIKIKFNIVNNLNTFSNHDAFLLYLKNKLIYDIIKLKIVPDLFCSKFLLNMVAKPKYPDTFENDHKYTYNSITKVEDNDPRLPHLNKFFEENITLSLKPWQKTNVLWLREIEDLVDKNKLCVPTFINKHKPELINSTNNIKSFLSYIRSRPEALFQQYNYTITTDHCTYVLDFKKNINIQTISNLIRIITGEDVRVTESVEHEPILDGIVPIKKYNDMYTQNINLCGGVLADEVGLGKTASIVSHIIYNYDRDQIKYDTYKKEMRSFLLDVDETNEDFKDPLSTGFEYNNLIIVPSNITSQWESEIKKYIENKFKLRVKVLVSLPAIKSLEKELHAFQKTIDKRKAAIDSELNSTNLQDNTKDDTKNNTKKKVKIVKKSVTITTSNKKTKATETTVKTENIIIPTTESAVSTEPIVSTESTVSNDPIVSTDSLFTNNDKVQNTIQDIDEVVEVIQIKEPAKRGRKPKPETVAKREQAKKKNKLTLDQSDLIDENIIEPVINEKPVIEPEYIKPSPEYMLNQLYDVYIVSVNLLSNENYLQHIGLDEKNHLISDKEESDKLKELVTFLIRNDITNPKDQEATKESVKLVNRLEAVRKHITGKWQICRYSDKFDIFKIKWNRIVLDEVHAKLQPPIKFSYSNNYYKTYNYTEQFLYECLTNLNSNYKWGLSGTPFANGVRTLAGIIQFLTKKSDKVTFNEQLLNTRYLINIIGINNADMTELIKKIYKQTLKHDVRQLLDIPIFTEEIVFVDQTNIERNIYNSIRCSRHFTDEVKQRRLFLMCTNILINEGYDFSTDNDITNNEILTLEELNANMIARFADQLRVVTSEATKLTKRNDYLTQYNQYFQSVYNYIAGLPSDLPPKIKADIDAKFGNFDSKLAAREMCQVFLSIIESYEFWLNLETIPIALITNREVFKTYCKNWHEDWESVNGLLHCTNYGAQFGEFKNKEEVTKNNKRLETIKNDQKRINNQIALFSNNEFLKEKTNDPCIICFESLNEVAITPCRHIFCIDCCKRLSNDLKSMFNCPECRNHINCKDLNLTNIEMINDPTKKKVVKSDSDDEKSDDEQVIDSNIEITPIMKKLGKSWKKRCINKYGSKMATLVEFLYNLFENDQNRVIIFSQYDKMLKMIGSTLEEFEIKFVYCTGNNFVLNKNINKFKTDKNIRIIMLSSETSNSGSNLTEANHIIFIDTLFQNPNLIKAIEAQAIGRAVRLGQKLPVKIIRFITRNTVEQEYFEKYRYDINILQN